MSKQPQGPTAENRILVELEVPAESALGREEAELVARESFYVELYRRGAIGSGRAAPCSVSTALHSSTSSPPTAAPGSMTR